MTKFTEGPFEESLRANVRLFIQAPAMYWALTQLLADLPTKRGWLDPVLEAEARAIIAAVDGV